MNLYKIILNLILLPNKMNNIKIEADKCLNKYTTLRIGGTAEFLSEPKNINELKFLISWAENRNISCNIIGAGSNLLINDQKVEGLSLCMRKLHGCNIDPITGEIEVLSGESLPHIEPNSYCL